MCLCRASVFVLWSLWVKWKEDGGEWGGFYGIVLLFGLFWGDAECFCASEATVHPWGVVPLGGCDHVVLDEEWIKPRMCVSECPAGKAYRRDLKLAVWRQVRSKVFVFPVWCSSFPVPSV